MTDYTLILSQAQALTEGIPYLTANLSNLSALLFDSLDRLNWAGFYEKKDGILVLSCFQGKPACVILPLTKGVCACAARENRIVNVPDVHRFDGHIACDSASQSELVLPIADKDGNVKYVLDLASPVLNRFTEADEQGLKKLAAFIADAIDGKWIK